MKIKEGSVMRKEKKRLRVRDRGCKKSKEGARAQVLMRRRGEGIWSTSY